MVGRLSGVANGHCYPVAGRRHHLPASDADEGAARDTGRVRDEAAVRLGLFHKAANRVHGRQPGRRSRCPDQCGKNGCPSRECSRPGKSFACSHGTPGRFGHLLAACRWKDHAASERRRRCSCRQIATAYNDEVAINTPEHRRPWLVQFAGESPPDTPEQAHTMVGAPKNTAGELPQTFRPAPGGSPAHPSAPAHADRCQAGSHDFCRRATTMTYAHADEQA